MKATFSGAGYKNTYHITLNNENSLESLANTILGKGEEFTFTLTVESTGKRKPICQAKGRYGVCDTVLSNDGTCENARNHEPEETTNAELTTASK